MKAGIKKYNAVFMTAECRKKAKNGQTRQNEERASYGLQLLKDSSHDLQTTV